MVSLISWSISIAISPTIVVHCCLCTINVVQSPEMITEFHIIGKGKNATFFFCFGLTCTSFGESVFTGCLTDACRWSHGCWGCLSQLVHSYFHTQGSNVSIADPLWSTSDLWKLPHHSQLKTFLFARCVVGVEQWTGFPLQLFTAVHIMRCRTVQTCV